MISQRLCSLCLAPEEAKGTHFSLHLIFFRATCAFLQKMLMVGGRDVE